MKKSVRKLVDRLNSDKPLLITGKALTHKVENNIPKPKTPEEEWELVHSDENIKGLIDLNREDAYEALPSARHLGLCLGLDTRGKDILNSMEKVAAYVDRPETQAQFFYQVLEYQLSQFVKDAAEAIQHAGKLQEYLHGARQSNWTLCQLRKEKNISKLMGR